MILFLLFLSVYGTEYFQRQRIIKLGEWGPKETKVYSFVLEVDFLNEQTFSQLLELCMDNYLVDGKLWLDVERLNTSSEHSSANYSPMTVPVVKDSCCLGLFPFCPKRKKEPTKTQIFKKESVIPQTFHVQTTSQSSIEQLSQTIDPMSTLSELETVPNEKSNHFTDRKLKFERNCPVVSVESVDFSFVTGLRIANLRLRNEDDSKRFMKLLKIMNQLISLSSLSLQITEYNEVEFKETFDAMGTFEEIKRLDLEFTNIILYTDFASVIFGKVRELSFSVQTYYLSPALIFKSLFDNVAESHLQAISLDLLAVSDFTFLDFISDLKRVFYLRLTIQSLNPALTSVNLNSKEFSSFYNHLRYHRAINFELEIPFVPIDMTPGFEFPGNFLLSLRHSLPYLKEIDSLEMLNRGYPRINIKLKFRVHEHFLWPLFESLPSYRYLWSISLDLSFDFYQSRYNYIDTFENLSEIVNLGHLTLTFTRVQIESSRQVLSLLAHLVNLFTKLSVKRAGLKMFLRAQVFVYFMAYKDVVFTEEHEKKLLEMKEKYGRKLSRLLHVGCSIEFIASDRIVSSHWY